MSKSPKDTLIQFRAEKEWRDRVNIAADSLGLSFSAYLRMVVKQRMDQDSVPLPPPEKKPKRH